MTTTFSKAGETGTCER